jgi:hypothetical protein
MQMRKEMASHIGPPGYDPQLDSKPKTKAVKRNERKKEKKRLQVSLILFLFTYSTSAYVMYKLFL